MTSPIVCRAYAMLGACLLTSTSAFAAIDLLPKEIEVRDKTASVRIVNHSARAEYVSISLAQLFNPGVPYAEEKREPVSEAARPALYAYPFRVSLAPGQSKAIKLKPVRPVDREQVYRLDVKPILKVLGDTRQAVAGNVTVNLSFSAIVRQLPASEHAEIAVRCDADGARIAATGNVRYAVKEATVDGKAVDDFNVYPGVPITLKGRVVKIPGQPACEAGAR